MGNETEILKVLHSIDVGIAVIAFAIVGILTVLLLRWIISGR